MIALEVWRRTKVNQLNRVGVLQKLDQKLEQKLGSNFWSNFSYQPTQFADTHVGAKVRGLTFAPTLAFLGALEAPTLAQKVGVNVGVNFCSSPCNFHVPTLASKLGANVGANFWCPGVIFMCQR